jgi:hypothetical protein
VYSLASAVSTALAQTDLGVTVPLEAQPELESLRENGSDDFAGFIADQASGIATVFVVVGRTSVAEQQLLDVAKRFQTLPTPGFQPLSLHVKEVDRS